MFTKAKLLIPTKPAKDCTNKEEILQKGKTRQWYKSIMSAMEENALLYLRNYQHNNL
jgi:hypothetical protein